MPHLDMSAYLSDDALTLDGIVSAAHPEGASYTITAPDALDWIRLQRIMAAGGNADSPDLVDDWMAFCTDADGNPITFREKLLGSALEQMTADGVSPGALEVIETVATTHYGLSAAAAWKLVRDAGGAKAPTTGATPTPASKPANSTPKRPAGSSSSRASSGTPARTRARTSGRSSTTPARKAAPKKAG